MKLRFHGSDQLHDARLAVGGPELQTLGFRALVVCKTWGKVICFTPPVAAASCAIVWATAQEWAALRDHGYAPERRA